MALLVPRLLPSRFLSFPPTHSTFDPIIVTRSAFSWPSLPGSSKDLGSIRKQYAERRILGYSPDQMFDIVSDIDEYRHFVPWCKNAVVSQRRPDFVKAAITVGFVPLTETYTANVQLIKPRIVKSVAIEGRLFHELVTIWNFEPGVRGNPNSATLNFCVSFEFKSKLHSHLSHMFFDEVVKMMVKAFIKRAIALHGPPSLEHKPPKILSYKS